MKMLASVLGGMLATLSGAHLSLGYLTMFSENMSASRGFVAVACVIFGGGNPPRVFLAALLFGFIDALGLRLQKYIPADITASAPYVVTVVMMVVVVLMKRRKKQSGVKEERLGVAPLVFLLEKRKAGKRRPIEKPRNARLLSLID